MYHGKGRPHQPQKPTPHTLHDRAMQPSKSTNAACPSERASERACAASHLRYVRHTVCGGCVWRSSVAHTVAHSVSESILEGGDARSLTCLAVGALQSLQRPLSDTSLTYVRHIYIYIAYRVSVSVSPCRQSHARSLTRMFSRICWQCLVTSTPRLSI